MLLRLIKFQVIIMNQLERPEVRRIYYLGHTVYEVLVPSNQAGFSVMEVRLSPESSPSCQITVASAHRVFRVLAGAILATINDGEQAPLTVGGVLSVPAGQKCVIRSTTRGITLLEIISSDGTMEQFLERAGTSQPGQPTSPAEVAEELGLEVSDASPVQAVINPYLVSQN